MTPKPKLNQPKLYKPQTNPQKTKATLSEPQTYPK